MIYCLFARPLGWLFLGLSSALFLGACVPSMTSSSTSLERDFALLQRQQNLQAEQLDSLQQQLARLEEQLQNSTGIRPPSQQDNAPVATRPVTIPASISSEVTELAGSAATYLAAFSNLAAGRFADAETGFDNFLNSYPDHQYTANARYWMASAQLSQNKLDTAASNLRQVVLSVAGQERAPAALVMLARIYQQQQLENRADEVLEQLRTRYPQSREAQQFFQTEQTQ